MTVLISLDTRTREMRRWEHGSIELGVPEKLHRTHEAFVHAGWDDLRATFHVMRYDPPAGFSTDPRVTAEHWTGGQYGSDCDYQGGATEPSAGISKDVLQPDR